jgi:rSAM/selenodomain-associated transferase 2
MNRYIWEGYILNHGFNPYVHAPNDSVLRPLINDIWQGINHKDASACYPPLVLLLFRSASLISPTLHFFKMVIVSFDVATVGLLIGLVHAHGQPMKRVLLYALNPLVLVFVAGEGHLDAIQVFFISLCFLFFARDRTGWGFFYLGCAIMTKYFALVFTPFLLHAKNWKKSVWLLGVLGLSYLPFWGTGKALFATLVPFGTVMHYNDSLTALFRVFLGQNGVWISVPLLGLCLLAVFLLVRDPVRGCYLAAGSLLLLLGTLHPWYLLLITPFLVFFPSRAWLYLHLAVVFTFPVLQVQLETGVFQEMPWVRLLEFIPFYGLLLWDFARRRRVLSAPVFDPVRSISVVVPTLNESAHIGECLRSLNKENGMTEAIVADGGSTDGTQEIASRMGFRVVNAKTGRGVQIKTGIPYCQGDVILVLHADCTIRERIPGVIIQELNKNPRCIGGALGMEFFHGTVKDRVISWLNNVRARWTGIAFGDQAQFFRKGALPLMGGFPELMMMEDLELSMRLKENGDVCFIPQGVKVSKRRWEAVGFLTNGTWIIRRCIHYLWQRRLGMGETSARDSYDWYYSGSHLRLTGRDI